MSNQFEPPKKGIENSRKKQVENLDSFSKTHNLSSAELDIAYKMAKHETLKQTHEPFPEEVYRLAVIMEVYIKKGLAENSIIDLINEKRALESTVSAYHYMVESMPIHSDEKRTLHFILEKKQAGKIIVVNKKTREQKSFTTYFKSKDAYPKESLAKNLLRFLDEFQDQDIFIVFIPSVSLGK